MEETSDRFVKCPECNNFYPEEHITIFGECFDCRGVRSNERELLFYFISTKIVPTNKIPDHFWDEFALIKGYLDLLDEVDRIKNVNFFHENLKEYPKVR